MGQEEYRQLSEAERKIVLKQLEELKSEREHNNYLVHYADLMLNEGLWQNFLLQKRKMMEDKRTAVGNVMNIEKTIITLNEQLTKGVAPKQKEEDKKGVK